MHSREDSDVFWNVLCSVMMVQILTFDFKMKIFSNALRSIYFNDEGEFLRIFLYTASYTQTVYPQAGPQLFVNVQLKSSKRFPHR